jgi:hypothetical protein
MNSKKIYFTFSNDDVTHRGKGVMAFSNGSHSKGDIIVPLVKENDTEGWKAYEMVELLNTPEIGEEMEVFRFANQTSTASYNKWSNIRQRGSLPGGVSIKQLIEDVYGKELVPSYYGSFCGSIQSGNMGVNETTKSNIDKVSIPIKDITFRLFERLNAKMALI